MSFRTDFLKTVDDLRAISGPSGFDIRVNQVTIRTRTWDGGLIGKGNANDSDLVLPAQYPVRFLTAQDVFSSSGEYEVGDILVDHITPSDGAGTGYTPQQLRPDVTTDNVEIIYVISGQHAGEYRCIDLRAFRAFTTQLVLRRRGETP